MTKTIAVVSGGLRKPSSTRLLADLMASAVERALTADGDRVEVETFELRDHAHDLTNNLLTGFASPELQEVIDAVTSADAIVAVSPTFHASFSGLFKTFVDVIEEHALRGIPVLIAATGGTERHSLALEFALRPLFAHLGAIVIPTGVYAASEDWGGAAGNAGSDSEGRSAHPALHQRIERAAGELADALSGRQARHTEDPFENPVPFEQLLRGD